MFTIDLFTTPKPFTGLTAIHQANALRSWRSCTAVQKIFVFGAVSGETNSIAESGAEVILDVECTDNGLPSIRSMFEIAAEKSEADLLMFTNADMIYLPAFFAAVESCRTASGTGFLLVGSRMDFDSEREFSFLSPVEITEFEAYANESGKMHPPAGSDYFIFPRRQYLENRLPDLWIGRGGWDLYMIYHAKSHGFLTIDLSPSVWGYHQNHDYSIRGKDEGVSYEADSEAVYNLSQLPEGVPWNHWTLVGCAKEWAAGALRDKEVVGNDQKAQNKERKRNSRRNYPRNGKNRAARQSQPGFVRRLVRRLRRALGKPVPAGKRAPAAFIALTPDPQEGLRRELQKAAAAGEPIRLVVGAAKTAFEGWHSSNIDSLNLLERSDWESLIGSMRLDRVLAEHVWEHLSPADGITALRNVADHLKPGGRVRIAVPDGHHPDPAYIEHVRPGGIGPGADDHQILYTAEVLEAAMREAGLVPEKVEHWDATGEFHAEEWDPADGQVLRSSKCDPRNAGGLLKYTSLIVDGVKPS